MKDLEKLLQEKMNARQKLSYEITHLRETIAMLKEFKAKVK